MCVDGDRECSERTGPTWSDDASRPDRAAIARARCRLRTDAAAAFRQAGAEFRHDGPGGNNHRPAL